MRKTIFILGFLLVISMTAAYNQNAPVTIAPDMSSCTNMSIDIPITVTDFFNIGAVSLTLNYDPAVLSYESYFNDSGFPGLVINGAIPGSIIAGGYINQGDQGILLDEDAVLFTLTFYYAGGYTDLSWNDDGESCEYTDNLFYSLNDSPTTNYYLNGSVSPIQPINAPITSLPEISICPDTYVDVPITVSDFCRIGAVSLTMNYNSSTLIYQSFTNNSGFPGLVVNESTPGTIIAGGYISPGDPGISLPDNAVLFTLTFFNIGGSTDLSWYDDGESCEYTDNLFNPLDDSPTGSYYLDGSVTPYQPLNAPVTTAPHIIAYAGSIIEVPVTVSDFCKIGALSLTMNYNPAVLTFQSYTDDAGFPGLTVNGSIPGSIFAGAYLSPGDPGFSLHDNDVLFTLNFLYNGGITALSWYDNGESCEYTDNLFNPLIDSPTANYYINGSVNGGLNLALKVFLEGPFQNTEMTTHLNDLHLLPFVQPYSSNPWQYYGNEYAIPIPNSSVVDWILVEIRQTSGTASSATTNTRIARQAGLLLNNGEIVATDGSSPLTFNAVLVDDLYAIVWHRNHLGVMSAMPLVQIGNIHNYDFSSGENQAYGGNLGHKEIFPGVWGMMGGDGIVDGFINDDDIIQWRTTAGTKGNLPSDFTMDSQVENTDKNDIWYWNFGSESQVPD